ncbi:MAG: hypothetical protein QM778_33130 [Myxococcales bacterium]
MEAKDRTNLSALARSAFEALRAPGQVCPTCRADDAVRAALATPSYEAMTLEQRAKLAGRLVFAPKRPAGKSWKPLRA